MFWKKKKYKYGIFLKKTLVSNKFKNKDHVKINLNLLKEITGNKKYKIKKIKEK